MSRICTRFLLSAALIPCNVVWVVGPLFAQQESPSAQTPPSSAAQPSNLESSEPGTLVIRKSVHRVILDVVVTDSNEKPVHGLTREDFSVDEDGKPQRVLSFDVHDFNAPADVPKVPPLPPNTFMNVPPAPERGPLNVILYDMVNMSLDDQGTARKQLLSFISEKPPGARFAIFVLSDGLRLVQGFTADRSVLYAAMDPKAPRPHVPKVFLYGENYGQGQIRLVRWAFAKVARFLDPLPGRKNVIWLTGSVPTSILATADGTTDPLSYSDEIKETVNAMARSQIAVYPVDVRGVVPVALGSSPKAGPAGVAMSTTSNHPYLSDSYLTEGDIAGSTGGYAFFSGNDVKGALEQATETGSNYYTLTYSPSNQKYDGQLRKLHVELAKRGYQLAYRRSYYAYNPDLPAPQGTRKAGDSAREAVPRDALFVNMQHGAPLTHQLLFKAHLQPLGVPTRATQEQMANLGQLPEDLRARRKKRAAKALLSVQLQTYAVEYTVAVDPLTQTRSPQPFTLEVAAAAFDGDGDMLNVVVESGADSAIAGPGEQLGASFMSVNTHQFRRAQLTIDVPVSATSIRLAAHDVSTDRVGAMEVSLPLGHEGQTQADVPLGPDQGGFAGSGSAEAGLRSPAIPDTILNRSRPEHSYQTIPRQAGKLYSMKIQTARCEPILTADEGWRALRNS